MYVAGESSKLTKLRQCVAQCSGREDERQGRAIPANPKQRRDALSVAYWQCQSADGDMMCCGGSKALIIIKRRHATAGLGKPLSASQWGIRISDSTSTSTVGVLARQARVLRVLAFYLPLVISRIILVHRGCIVQYEYPYAMIRAAFFWEIIFHSSSGISAESAPSPVAVATTVLENSHSKYHEPITAGA